MTFENRVGRQPQMAHRCLLLGAVICSLSVVLVTNTPAETKDKHQSKTVASASIGFYQKYISDLRYGRCQFEPSCSQYAKEAIEAHGWFMGTALAADRLVRCNSGAKRYYQRGNTGRLVDNVDTRSIPLGPPRVPGWLTPQPARPPLPKTASHLSSGVTETQLSEYADFADALADEGDYERAITEYKRVAFLANSPAVDTWSRLRIGRSYYDAGRWSESASAFVSAGEGAFSTEDRYTACFMTAASYFSAGHYKDSANCLTRCSAENPFDAAASDGRSSGRSMDNLPAAAPGSAADCLGTAQLRFLDGLTLFAAGEWTASATRFDELAVSCPAWEYRNRAFYLAARCEDGSELRMKHPNLAAVMSAVIPGSGQMYSGRVFDGFRHLVIDGLLIYSVYQLFKNEYYAGGYLLAGFTLPFYVGNVVGAKRASEQRNTTTRTRFVSQSIAEAGQQ